MPCLTYFTSESVSEGHPDKVADQISDAVVDLVLAIDPQGKAAVETMIGPGYLVIGGEVSAQTTSLEETLKSSIPTTVRSLLRRIGYTDAASGFDFDTCDFQLRLSPQSPEIRAKVEREDQDVGAGDQGLMFGYACDETATLMPAALYHAHRLLECHAERRKSGLIPAALPDAKAQVTVRYREGEFDGVSTIVLSSQHRPTCLAEFRECLLDQVINPTIPPNLRTQDCTLLINPGGSFILGGPAADTGLTGRKIIVDTYGGRAPHGGGAFSGKDASKVDRSVAYAARWIAKNIVAAKLARRCTLQLAYAIGEVQPVSLLIDTENTATVPDAQLEHAVRATFDLSPKGIIKALDLYQPRYLATASYGHFGRDFPWERTDRVDELLRVIRSTQPS